MPLEERVVLDAEGASEVVDSYALEQAIQAAAHSVNYTDSYESHSHESHSDSNFVESWVQKTAQEQINRFSNLTPGEIANLVFMGISEDMINRINLAVQIFSITHSTEGLQALFPEGNKHENGGNVEGGFVSPFANQSNINPPTSTNTGSNLSSPTSFNLFTSNPFGSTSPFAPSSIFTLSFSPSSFGSSSAGSSSL